MTHEELNALCEKGLAVEGGGSDPEDRGATRWYRNPDGPELVAAIRELHAKLAEAREAGRMVLKAFDADQDNKPPGERIVEFTPVCPKEAKITCLSDARSFLERTAQ